MISLTARDTKHKHIFHFSVQRPAFSRNAFRSEVVFSTGFYLNISAQLCGILVNINLLHSFPLHFSFSSILPLLGQRSLCFPPSRHQLNETAWGWPSWPSGPAVEGSGTKRERERMRDRCTMVVVLDREIDNENREIEREENKSGRNGAWERKKTDML